MRTTDAEVRAPRWTLGLRTAEVAAMHAEGRKVFAWTVDRPVSMLQYLNEEDMDGILRNYPMLIAHYELVRQ